MRTRKILSLLLLAILLAGCSGQYIGQPREAVLSYQTDPTYGSLYELAMAYAETINASVKADTLHPGMYADYGVALALMGHDQEACRMLNAEVKAFPQSYGMVSRIQQRMLPGCPCSTEGRFMHDTADIAQLVRWAYDSLTALQPLPPIAAVIDSTDTAMIAKQTPVDSVEIPIRLTANQKRQMLEDEQMREEMARQAKIDSVAAAKQAKIDARKQAQVDKKKAKKEKERAKKKAEKEKKKRQIEKKKQQELKRKQMAAERKAKQKAKEQESKARKQEENKQEGK